MSGCITLRFITSIHPILLRLPPLLEAIYFQNLFSYNNERKIKKSTGTFNQTSQIFSEGKILLGGTKTNSLPDKNDLWCSG